MSVDFGYSIPLSRAIDLDRTPPEPIRRLSAKVPSLAGCIGCGACTAGCTAGALTTFNPRVEQTLCRRGERPTAQAESCLFCGKCRLVCPRGVDTRRIKVVLYDERLLF